MTDLSTLEKVKIKLGRNYSDPLNEADLSQMIEECRADMIGAGVPEYLTDSPLGIANMAIYCKMAQSMSADDMKINAVYLSNIAKLRNMED